MKLHPRLSRTAVELARRFETFQPRAVATPDGWTVGYGHTRSAREGIEVGREDAEALLLYDMSAAAETVSRYVYAPLTQPQFDALAAFAFNIGPDSFRRSTALARVNAGAYLDAADEIERWRRAELGSGAQVVDALVRRRAAEKAHFLSLPPGASVTASPLLRPLADPEPEAVTPGEPQLAADPAAGPHYADQPSATLAAANTVQARLRDLIPDLAPVAPLAVVPLAGLVLAEHEHEPPPPPMRGETLVQPMVAATPAHGEPPPPPFANDHAPPPAIFDPLSEEGLDPPAPPADPVAVEKTSAEPGAKTGWLPLLRRFGLPVVGLLGVLLFVIAVLGILAGKFSLGGLGLVGAVAMAAGLYGVLGMRRE